MLACDAGGPVSIPGRYVLSLGALVEDGEDLGQVSADLFLQCDPTFEHSFLAECMSAIPWSHVQVPNSNSISCSNSSVLECLPVTGQFRFPAETCLSLGALVEDEYDLGQDSS